jgi:predicted branched-subunit amino acid permease
VEDSPYRFDLAAFLQGIRDGIPLAIPAFPFGLVVGFAATQAPISTLAGWSTSQIIFAGSAQLVALELFAAGSAGWLIVAAVFMINSRHFMYSAAMKSRIEGAPMWFRIIGGYVLMDQLFAIQDAWTEDPPLRFRMWHWLGCGTLFWTQWQIGVLLGLSFGDVIPESWGLTFVIPLMFGGLMILSIRNRPGLLAAVVGGSVTIALQGLPPGWALLIGIIAGVTAGAVADARIDVEEPAT